MLVTMTDYIHATREKVLNNINKAHDLVKDIVNLYTKKKYQQIIFVASGSSYTALQCARNYMCKTLKTDVKILNPYTFSHYDIDYVTDEHFVVIVSQSGASTNCVEALTKLKDRHLNSYVLTGIKECDCANYADVVLDWGCGIETMVYVTLGVVSLVVYCMLFAAIAANKLGYSDELEYVKEQITKAMKNHKEVCDKTEAFYATNEQTLYQLDRVYVLGSGSNYGTALEGALKMGETIKVLAVGYEQDEFLHGPALQLSPKYSAFIIDGGDETKEHALTVFKGLCKVTANAYMITSQDVDHPHILHVDDPCDEPFTCLYNLPFFELLADIISTKLDSKKDHPLYYEMNKIIDFRTPKWRESHKPED